MILEIEEKKDGTTEKEPMVSTFKIKEVKDPMRKYLAWLLCERMLQEPKKPQHTQVPDKLAEQDERCPKISIKEVSDKENNIFFLWSYAEPPKAKPVVLPAKKRALSSDSKDTLQSIHDAKTLKKKIAKLWV
ncbi:uncharacterized protein BT62DRAFT_918356 [Guyanagaster necrorhizus]|uniref:Uncharacterized protein n=1 Tax=Guyanagaster necrorhizus TaxID=856835 RepID=A0A9P7VYK6_9AGAR|nr:uncharacterized protein BT62DRAFT_918356 [Guyanagaster necrorhizus MCA 3950]KAG7448830.1 hypothetical protein BT62DRAFT_918356 [Guyanagaster necrorhizus MCA 3950]